MARILKIEAFSGASGDMFLAALAELANSYDELLKLPMLLSFQNEAEIRITKVNINGIVCKNVKVVDLAQHQPHRHLSNIIEIIDTSELTENAKKISREIFNIIGKAESEVHDIPLEKIHFHEVGAIDSIIDICGAAYLLDKLKIGKTYLTDLVTGKGFVKTAHGVLPVPCPATKLIIQNIPYTLGDEEGEKLTPTGAAIIKYLKPITQVPKMKDIRTSYGAGEKVFENPNVLRLSISEVDEIEKNEVVVIEANIDDMNSEHLGSEFQSNLLENGALDFYFTQVIMKKGRPGIVLNIICKEDKFNNVSEFILKFTSTIGLRYYITNRIELERNIEDIEIDLGKFRIKTTTLPDGSKKIKPDSEEILKVAYQKNINPNLITQEIIGKYEKDN